MRDLIFFGGGRSAATVSVDQLQPGLTSAAQPLFPAQFNRRSNDRRRQILDPQHQEELLKEYVNSGGCAALPGRMLHQSWWLGFGLLTQLHLIAAGGLIGGILS
jgi:hypothetical protein